MNEMDGQMPDQSSIYVGVVPHQQALVRHGLTSLTIGEVELELHLQGIPDLLVIIHQEVDLMLTSRLAAEMEQVRICFLQS